MSTLLLPSAREFSEWLTSKFGDRITATGPERGKWDWGGGMNRFWDCTTWGVLMDGCEIGKYRTLPQNKDRAGILGVPCEFVGRIPSMINNWEGHFNKEVLKRERPRDYFNLCYSDMYYMGADHDCGWEGGVVLDTWKRRDYSPEIPFP